MNSFLGSEYIPLEIKEIKKKNNHQSSRKNSKIVLEFTQIMNQLISSGLTIKDSLEILSVMDEKNGSSKLSLTIFERIQKGNSFAKSVNELDNYFSAVYRGIINVGDRVGSVEKIFPKLKTYLENQKKISDKFLSALLYPVLVLITALVAFITMIFFVFPKLEGMFSDFGGSVAEQMQQNINKMETGVVVFLIIVFCVFLLCNILVLFSKNNQSIKYQIDSLILKFPILGKIIVYREILNFSFAMETLTASGISIETALMESTSVLTNSVFKSSIQDVHNRIIKGESLSSSFSRHKHFPTYFVKWMLVGEKSGKTDQIFSEVKNYFQSEMDVIISKFMSLIEPALIVVVGLFLIIFIITIVLPVFSLYGEILV